jgi:hypothetical protein
MFEDLIAWFEDIMDDVADTFFAMLSDLFLFIIDMLMSSLILVVTGMMTGLDFINIGEYIQMIPEEARSFMVAVRFPEAFTIISSATFIKLIMKMIPFVRL